MKLETKNYKHFSFDLWLTLIKSNPNYKLNRNLLFKDFFEIEFPIEKVSEVVRYYDLLCNNINEKTGLNLDTFEIYSLILNALNVNFNNITLDKYNDFYKESELLFNKYKPDLIYPKIYLFFKEIVSQEKTINILSNTGFIKGSTLKKLLSFYELEEYISFQIYSDEIKMSKPNREIFQLVYDKIINKKFLDKREIVHVGDNEIADYNGAINFGFNGLLIKLN